MKTKKKLEINLSQFRVWKDLQMIYLLFIFIFLLFIDSWVELILGARLISFIFLCVGLISYLCRPLFFIKL
jgi:hypothetical protein